MLAGLPAQSAAPLPPLHWMASEPAFAFCLRSLTARHLKLTSHCFGCQLSILDLFVSWYVRSPERSFLFSAQPCILSPMRCSFLLFELLNLELFNRR